MQKIPDFQNFWRFWSVRLSILSGAISAAAGAYGAMLLIDRSLVAGLPAWAGLALTGAAMVTAFAASFARGVVQEKLSGPPQ